MGTLTFVGVYRTKPGSVPTPYVRASVPGHRFSLNFFLTFTCFESSIFDQINKFNLALAKLQKHQYTTYYQFQTFVLIRKHISDAETYIVLDFS